jgi:hypothetical protein
MLAAALDARATGRRLPDPKTTVSVFALAEVRGQIEPCGCTTDPLGDLARTAQLVAEARTRGPVVVVDAGSLLYARATIDPMAKPQEDLKADLLARVYEDELQVAAVGLGPTDLAAGPEQLRLPRQVANLPASAGVRWRHPTVISVGAEKIGVFGVIARRWCRRWAPAIRSPRRPPRWPSCAPRARPGSSRWRR